MHWISKVGGQEGSLTTDIPAGIAQKLDVRPGNEIVWIEDGAGGYRVMPLDDMREMLLIHEEIIGEYEEVFDALSNRE